MQSNVLFEALQTHRAFVNYKLIPKANSPKLDKVPVNPHTGYDSDAQDPSTWVLPYEAAAYPDYGVGLVIYEGCQLFCLDIDNCLQADGTWSEIALKCIAMFPGACVEVSVSGRGLHIFGRFSGTLPPHGTRNAALGLELYWRRRFIAVSGTHMSGDVFLDCTAPLLLLIQDYFPVRDAPAQGGWTDAPVAAWRGPSDDDELIALMKASRPGIGHIFGARASLHDLWEADPDALARTYPSQGNDSWDESAADLALANHLAFWTGSDCERMHRLMWQSKLIRPKWERDDYMRATVLAAASAQKTWYCSPSSLHPVPAVGSAPSLPSGEEGEVQPTEVPRPAPGTYLLGQEQEQLFAGCVYVRDIHQVLLPPPKGELRTSERFDTEFSGYEFQITADGRAPSKSAWEAFVHSKILAFPKVDGMYFGPRDPPRSIQRRDGLALINSWMPVHIPRVHGDPTPFLTHLRKCYPIGQDAEILLAYFAFVAQYPGVKARWAPLLQGVEGNGKTYFSQVLQYCVGRKYTHWPKASELDSRFNAVIYGKLLLAVEDVKISEAKGSMWETLKPMITGDQLEIEGKGVEKLMRDICFNFILNSNHKDAIRKTRNDRRIAPFFGAQQHDRDLDRDGMGPGYFLRLWNWMNEHNGFAIVADYLMRYSIPDEYNPARDAIRAPITSSTEAAIRESLGSVEQEVLAAIEDGVFGFCGGWISSMAFTRLLESTGKARQIAHNKRKDIILSLGYVQHPGLTNDGKCSALVDGTRPRLYIKEGHPSITLTDTGYITQAFQAAQLQKPA